MIKNMGEDGKKAYLHLANFTLKKHIKPKSWQSQDIQPTPKPNDPNSFRPISLMSCLLKTAERMVLKRLQWKTGPLHPRQFAFTEGVGTTECIIDVLTYINNGASIAVFLDLEKAFELANAEAIIIILTMPKRSSGRHPNMGQNTHSTQTGKSAIPRRNLLLSSIRKRHTIRWYT